MTDQTPMVIVDANQLRRERMGQNILEAFENPENETVPGGKFLVDGVLVDSNGDPVKGASPREEAPKDPPFDEGVYAGKSFNELKEMAEARDVKFSGNSRKAAIQALQEADEAKPPVVTPTPGQGQE